MIEYYWHRAPGLFVNKLTGEEIDFCGQKPQFTGTVREWYEVLGEVLHDAYNDLELEAGEVADVVVSRLVFPIIEASVLFRPDPSDVDVGYLRGIMRVHRSPLVKSDDDVIRMKANGKEAYINVLGINPR